MSDDRVAGDLVEVVATMRRELDDLRSTALVRAGRLPTGMVVMSLLPVALPDTLLCRGETRNRADFPVLWDWVQSNDLVTAGWFGAGNGTTTFVLPDWEGLVPIGAGTRGANTYNLGGITGAPSRTIATAQMPAHDHNVGASITGSISGDTHAHGASSAANGGNHGGHFPGSQVVVPEGNVFGVAPWNSGGTGNNAHSHGVTVNDDTHSHGHSLGVSVSEQQIGGTTPLDVRQESVAFNFLIYT